MPHQPDAVLLVEKGTAELSVIPLDRQVFILGKSPTADIVFDHVHVSRKHAQITLDGGRFQIRDLGEAKTAPLSMAPVKERDSTGCEAAIGSSWPAIR